MNDNGSVFFRVLVLIGALSLFVGLSLVGCQWGGDEATTQDKTTPSATNDDPALAGQDADNPEASHETGLTSGQATASTTPTDVGTRPATDETASGTQQAPAESQSPATQSPATQSPATESAPGQASTAPVTYEEADGLYESGDYAAAAAAFGRYTTEHPDRTEGWTMLGLAAWKSGDLDVAADALERVLETQPDHAKARVNLARVLIDDDKPRQAVPHVEHVLDRDEGDVVARRVLARAQAEMGEYEAAETSYRAALVLDDSDVWSLNNLGYLMIEMERFEEALGPLARAVELNEHSPVFRNNLGTALERTGHYRAAALAYQGAIDADSTYARAVENLDRVTRLGTDPAADTFDLRAEAAAFVSSLRQEAEATEPTASYSGN